VLPFFAPSEYPLSNRTKYCYSYLRANGWRYPLVGGMRQCHFDGTSLKPRKLPENAQTPTSRVHALLGGTYRTPTFLVEKNTKPILANSTQNKGFGNNGKVTGARNDYQANFYPNLVKFSREAASHYYS
jgi:hypothetical protein